MDYRGVPLVRTDNEAFPFAEARKPLPTLEVTSTMRETSHPSLGVLENFLVASIAAGPARLAVHPFSVSRACSQVGIPGFKTGPARSFFWMWRMGGIKAFTSGLPLSIAKSCPFVGIQFSVFDALAKRLVPKVPNSRPSIYAFTAIYACGGIAGAVAQAVLHPLDVVKTRLFVQGLMTEPAYLNGMDCFRKILAADGVAGFYRGFGPSVIGAYLFCGQMFATWDFFHRLPWIRRDAHFLYFENVLEALLSIAMASFVSAPFDTLRRKLMAFDRRLPLNGRVDVVAESSASAARLMLIDGGLSTFWRGYLASAMKIAPQAAVFYALFKSSQYVMLIGSKKKSND